LLDPKLVDHGSTLIHVGAYGPLCTKLSYFYISTLSVLSGLRVTSKDVEVIEYFCFRFQLCIMLVTSEFAFASSFFSSKCFRFHKNLTAFASSFRFCFHIPGYQNGNHIEPLEKQQQEISIAKNSLHYVMHLHHNFCIMIFARSIFRNVRKYNRPNQMKHFEYRNVSVI